MSEARKLEEPVRLSKSILWDIQKEFYLRNGVEFWNERDCFTASSMMVVAAFVDATISLLRLNIQKIDFAFPIYFLEIGSGSGSFAYKFLTSLLNKLEEEPDLKGLQVRFVATDIIPEIIDVWKGNKFFRPLVIDEKLDFAVYDPVAQKSLSTVCSDWSLTQGCFVNAPVIFANAVFDTIAVDGFSFENGVASEILGSVISGGDDPVNSLKANTLQLEQSHQVLRVGAYYEDDKLERILRDYKKEIKHASVSIPVGAISVLQKLGELTGERFTLFCCSRGYNEILDNDSFKELRYHDLSFPLNFDALQKYIYNWGGSLFVGVGFRQEVGSIMGFGLSSRLIKEFDYESSAASFVQVASELFRSEQVAQSRLKEYRVETSVLSALDFFLKLMEFGKNDVQLFVDAAAILLDAMEVEIPTAADCDKGKLVATLHEINKLVYSFCRDVPDLVPTNDPLALLIRVWQRANVAHQMRHRGL